jgi:hypothetical protein
MSVSSKVYVRKAVTDIDPRTGRPLSMMRIQDFGHDIGRGIMSSKIPVPRASIDYEDVVRPDYRFPVGEITSPTSDKYPDAYGRALDDDYPRFYRGSEWKFKPDMGRGYVMQENESVVEPNQGLFFTPGNLQDIGSAVVTGTDEYAPSRLVGVTSDPRSEGVHIRPAGAQQEALNEVFMTEDIPASQAYDLTPIYTRDRDYNPLWFNQKEKPRDRYLDDRGELTRQNAADRGQLQGLAQILNRNPAMFHRPTSKPLTFDERTFTHLADQAGVDPSLYRLDDESDEYTYADPGPMMDFLREKVNLRPMDRGYTQALASRGMQPNFSQRTFGIPDGGFSQMPIDEFNLPVGNNMEVPPEYFSANPEQGFFRQGIDIDDITQRINAQDMTKSDISIADPLLGVSMDAFTEAWKVLKATLPIKPETMQWETDPRRHRNYKQTGGVARRAREKMMDEAALMDADVDDEQLMGRKNPIVDIYGNDRAGPNPWGETLEEQYEESEPLPKNMQEIGDF